MQAAFPEWFGQPGHSENTCYQHLSRARRDVQDLLMAIISWDKFLSEAVSGSPPRPLINVR